MFAPPQDLVLRPTTLDSGLYEGEGGPFAVAKHSDGHNYLLLWFEAGKAVTEPGDLLLQGVTLTDTMYDYGDAEGVTVETIRLETP
jgi:hypothetical protein